MNMQYTEDASGITLVIDEQPDVQPAPSYDVSMDDWEVDGMAITSAQMAKDFLQSGRALMCVCGPLHVIAGADENPGVSDCSLWIWSTATSYNIDHDCKNITLLLDQMQTFGYLFDGSWSVYCPREE